MGWDEQAEKLVFSAPADIAQFSQRLPPASRVLDLGCAYGRLSAELVAYGHQTRGYDAAKALLKRGLQSQPSLDLRYAQADALPEEEGSFDGVLMCALLSTVQSVEKRHAIVAEAHRVLRPGAYLHGVDFLAQQGRRYNADLCFEAHNGLPMKHFTILELQGLFKGFTAWSSRLCSARSLSGQNLQALQYFAQRT